MEPAKGKRGRFEVGGTENGSSKSEAPMGKTHMKSERFSWILASDWKRGLVKVRIGMKSAGGKINIVEVARGLETGGT